MFVIYSKPNCPFCTKAKDLLEVVGEDYIELNVQEGNNLEALTNILGYSPKTVPQIWDEDEHIGGYEELKIYMR